MKTFPSCVVYIAAILTGLHNFHDSILTLSFIVHVYSYTCKVSFQLSHLQNSLNTIRIRKIRDVLLLSRKNFSCIIISQNLVDLFIAAKQCMPNLLCTMLKLYPEGLKDTLYL